MTVPREVKKMKVTKEHKKGKCPKCGSKEILTLGLDQMCFDCVWDNSLMLVQLGQLDNLFLAKSQQFDDRVSFELLPDSKQPEQESKDCEVATVSMPLTA
jgi:hypothetical protein